MKKKILSFIFAFALVVSGCLCFSSCGVVPCAWVKLDMEGYVYYSSDMYGTTADHIYLYESQEIAASDTHRVQYLLSINFYPRILGADTVNDERTTTVDISKKGYSMHVTIDKDEMYSPEKKLYLNDVALEPTTSNIDGAYLVFFTYENFTFVRGNPGGRLNGKVNKIEYK